MPVKCSDLATPVLRSIPVEATDGIVCDAGACWVVKVAWASDASLETGHCVG